MKKKIEDCTDEEIIAAWNKAIEENNDEIIDACWYAINVGKYGIDFLEIEVEE